MCGKSHQPFFCYICLNLNLEVMASIKLGAIIADIKGKINGNYFAKRNNTTILARCGSKLTKADAGRQSLQIARIRVAQISRSWKSISAEQLLKWNNAAALLTWYTKVGVPYTPSGYQLYSQCNMNRNVLNLSAIKNPVIPTDPADVNIITAGFSAPGVMTYSYGGTLGGGKFVVISASYPNSIGRKYPSGGYKIVAIFGPDDVGPSVFTSSYEKVFGLIPDKGMVFFKAEIIDGDSGISEGSKLTKADAGLL